MLSTHQLSPAVRDQRRARLKASIVKLAYAIDAEEVAPTWPELFALAGLCEDYDLPGEAARIRFWMGERS